MFIMLELRNKCILPTNLKKPIQTLTRQAARWSTAADQDMNTLIAVLHANYGAGYLWALKDIATDSQIEEASGIDMKEFQNAIVSIQDKVTQDMAAKCPDFAPNPSYLSRIAKEG